VVNVTSSVAPGETITFSGLAAGDYTVEAGIPGQGWGSATVNGQSSVELTVEACDESVPDSSASLGDCEEITWTNTADQALSVRLTNDSGVVNVTSSVAPGETVTFTGLAAGDYTVEAGIPGQGWGSATVNSESSVDLSVEACIDGSASLDACGEITVTNDASSGASVRLINETGDQVDTVELDAGAQVTFSDLDPGEYTVTFNGQLVDTVTVDACIDGSASADTCGEVTVTNDASSGATARLINEDDKEVAKFDMDGDGTQYTFTDVAPGTYDVTLDGQVVDTITVEACIVECPADFGEFKVGSGNSDTQSGVEVTVAGDGSSATVKNTNNHPVSVWVKTGSRLGPIFREAATLDPGETDTVNGIMVQYDDKSITHDISNVAITCPDVDRPSVSPYTRDSHTKVSGDPVDASEFNDPPSADFTISSQNPEVSDTVTFDAAPSNDPDGSVVSYEWTFDDGTTDTGEHVTHSYSSTGTYTVELTVTDDGGATDSKTMEVTVKDTNQKPNADAGSNATVDANASVTLDATGSSDPDGDSLTYSWTELSNVGITLSDTTSATPTFTAPDFDNEGALTFQVTVSDGNGGTDTDTVVVSVQPTTTDTDEDGVPDSNDQDIDGDGVENSNDNCPETPNQDQDDLDADGDGDACDKDIDGDGVENDNDNAPEDQNEQSIASPGGVLSFLMKL
jgi:PKD repeat protein